MINILLLLLLLLLCSGCQNQTIVEVEEIIDNVTIAIENDGQSKPTAEIMYGEEVSCITNEDIITEESKKSSTEDVGVLKYLGMSKDDIITLFGQPDLIFDVPGPGGEQYYYRDSDIPVTFVFANYGNNIVNSLSLRKNAQINGIKIGMTLREMEEVLGEADSEGYDENFLDHGKPPWYAIYSMDITGNMSDSGVVLYVFFKENEGVSVSGTVFWESMP